MMFLLLGFLTAIVVCQYFIIRRMSEYFEYLTQTYIKQVDDLSNMFNKIFDELVDEIKKDTPQ